MSKANDRSLISWYQPGDAVVEPAVGKHRIDTKNAVLCFGRGSYPRLLRAFEAEHAKIGPLFDGAVRGRLIGGTALYQSYIGASAAAMLMEEMIASGVKRVLMLGLAGSITSNARIGDVVLPSWGIREEGTSHHYYPNEHCAQPSKTLNARLKRAMGRTEYLEGGVWTTDGVFRETRGKVARHSKAGVLAVEMECAALMCVAEYRGIDFAALLVISDELFDGDWRPAFGSKKVNDATDIVCEAAHRLFSTRRVD